MRWMSSVIPSWKADKEIIGALLMAVLMVLLLPLRWLLGALIAALIHEAGHYTAVRLMGGSVHRLSLKPSGAVMEASGLTAYSKFLCTLAGPLAGLLPLLVFRYFPVIAICGAVQSLFNILPIYPLDGGKMLRQIVSVSGGSHRCFQIIENSVFVLLFLLCIFIRYRFGVSLFMFLAFFVFRKTPCKLRED